MAVSISYDATRMPKLQKEKIRESAQHFSRARDTLQAHKQKDNELMVRTRAS